MLRIIGIGIGSVFQRGKRAKCARFKLENSYCILNSNISFSAVRLSAIKFDTIDKEFSRLIA